MSTRIGVIDHHAGNLVSIRGGLELAGATVVMVETPEQAALADGLVLPGVGAAPPAMKRLRERGLDEAVRSWAGPLLGICLGMQLLFDRSEEFGGSDNLGLVGGEVRPLVDPPRAIHMGWNAVAHGGEGLFAGLRRDEEFYFVHSLAAHPENARSITATCSYGGEFVAAIEQAHVSGVQFHPERSGPAGLHLLTNFVRRVRLAA